MGMDLYGEKPMNSQGEYFRNNVWWWRPLWQYVCGLEILTDEEMTAGEFNDGKRIGKRKAIKIADTLEALVKEGKTKQYETARATMLKLLPDEPCEICNGTGKRDDEYVKGKCNGCDGKGKRRPFSTNYGFNVDNVKEFIKFCRNSGGFRIC